MKLEVTLEELFAKELEVMIADDLASNTMRWEAWTRLILAIDFSDYLRLLTDHKRHYRALLQLDKQLN